MLLDQRRTERDLLDDAIADIERVIFPILGVDSLDERH